MKFRKASQAESCGLGLVAVQLAACSAGKCVHRWAENSDDEAEDAGWTEEPQL